MNPASPVIATENLAGTAPSAQEASAKESTADSLMRALGGQDITPIAADFYEPFMTVKDLMSTPKNAGTEVAEAHIPKRLPGTASDIVINQDKNMAEDLVVSESSKRFLSMLGMKAPDEKKNAPAPGKP
jgi:hypothetical protein